MLVICRCKVKNWTESYVYYGYQKWGEGVPNRKNSVIAAIYDFFSLFRSVVTNRRITTQIASDGKRRFCRLGACHLFEWLSHVSVLNQPKVWTMVCFLTRKRVWGYKDHTDNYGKERYGTRWQVLSRRTLSAPNEFRRELLVNCMQFIVAYRQISLRAPALPNTRKYTLTGNTYIDPAERWHLFPRISLSLTFLWEQRRACLWTFNRHSNKIVADNERNKLVEA